MKDLKESLEEKNQFFSHEKAMILKNMENILQEYIMKLGNTPRF